MLLKIDRRENDIELESKILAAAFRQSVERGDESGIHLAHAELCKLLTIGETQNSDHVELPSYEQRSLSHMDVYARLDFSEERPVDSLSCRTLAERPLPNPDGANYYDRIAAEQNDTFYFIQLCYMRAVRLLLRRNFRDGKLQAANIHDFRRHLRNMGIAYHLLNDPASRSDYDLRLSGIRTPSSGSGLYVPEDARSPISGGKVRLSFKELFALCGLSCDQELFLLGEEDFFTALAAVLPPMQVESLRTGYELMGKGLISVLQFQKAFFDIKGSEQKLVDFLVASGWLDRDIFDTGKNNFSEVEFTAPKIVEITVNVPPQAVLLPNLNMSGAVPLWASDMDWEEPGADSQEAEQESVADPPAETAAPPERFAEKNKKPVKNSRKTSKRRKKT